MLQAIRIESNAMPAEINVTIDGALFFVYFTLRAIRIESNASIAEIKVMRGER